MCGAEKQSQRVRAHEGVVGRLKSQWTTDFSRNSGTYIVYNSHVICSNSSFPLTMVTHTFHSFALHWLCCLLPIGYLPKPGSVDVRIYHYHRIQPRPQVRWYSDIFDRMHLFSIFTVFTAPVDMMTFRQSPCWYYPWANAAVSTSTDTQHLWAWWHFGNPLDIILERMQLSQHPLMHSTCRHDDVSVITPVLSIYLSTISAIFIPDGHVNILRKQGKILWNKSIGRGKNWMIVFWISKINTSSYDANESTGR